MPTKSFSPLLHACLRRIRAHGDAAFVLALLVSIGYAMLIFYRFIYPPVFVPPETQPQRAVFNTALYNTVIGEVESRNQRSSDALKHIPRNPFGEVSRGTAAE